jgi:NAD(P)-dependent dehydrogenase (short-subunit alcohol dehydrogenase family)
MPWTAASLPECTGKVAVVTGANSGVGFETAKALAQLGATVVLACRTDEKANDAANRIRATTPNASLSTFTLDLASQASVRAAAAALKASADHLDILINNAGVMWAPYSRTDYSETPD